MKSIKNLINSNTPLAALRGKLHQQQQLLEIVRKNLPAPLNDNCIAAVQQHKRLVIFTTTPALASRLRYEASRLQPLLLKHGLKIDRVHIKIFQPPSAKRHQQRAARLSPSNAETIRQSTVHITDPALKRAFLRLSRNR